MFLWLPPEAPCPGRHRRDPLPRVAPRNYEWVFEADIEACFDRIDHMALMGRVRDRIGDKRVLALVTAFLRAGLLSEDGLNRDTITGTPQGGILSPLLPTSPCPCSTSTSPRSGKRSDRPGLAPNVAAPVNQPCASSATRTTSWLWSPAPGPRPGRDVGAGVEPERPAVSREPDAVEAARPVRRAGVRPVPAPPVR